MSRSLKIVFAGIGPMARASFEIGQWLPDWRPTQDHRQSMSPVEGYGDHETRSARIGNPK